MCDNFWLHPVLTYEISSLDFFVITRKFFTVAMLALRGPNYFQAYDDLNVSKFLLPTIA